MALFLRGKYIGFYKTGTFEAVKDVFRFGKSAENKVSLEITRKDPKTILGKFLKLESNKMTLHPLDDSEPRQGGKVTVNRLHFDVRTLTFKSQTLYGIYGDDFVQFAEFNGSSSPLDDEERLLKITESIDDSDDIITKSTFRFENDTLSYSHEVNEKFVDPELVSEVAENQLIFSPETTWGERLFYGVGNQNM